MLVTTEDQRSKVNNNKPLKFKFNVKFIFSKKAYRTSISKLN